MAHASCCVVIPVTVDDFGLQGLGEYFQGVSQVEEEEKNRICSIVNQLAQQTMRGSVSVY